jgi:quercetin dioxygenase-like cupin family protein
MRLDRVTIRRWQAEAPPDEALVQALLAEEGLEAFRWGNAAGEVYPPHMHGYDKVIYVVEGSIAFGLPEGRASLQAGDRLDLPAGVEHSASVGPQGVRCLEAHR